LRAGYKTPNALEEYAYRLQNVRATVALHGDKVRRRNDVVALRPRYSAARLTLRNAAALRIEFHVY
jgi:hypothetical protein